MEDFNMNIDILIAKKLAGECTPKELENFNNWLNLSKENQSYFNSLEKLWANSDSPELPELDTEHALRQVKQKIRSQKERPPLKINYGRQLIRIAAAILFLAAAIFFIQKPDKPTQTIAATDTSLQDILSDGSSVKVAPNSAVVLSSNFNKKERRLRLKGKAEFNVKADKKIPFVVEVQNIEVTVVGTVFSVDEHSQKGFVFVRVTEGIVRVKNIDFSVELHAGDIGVYDKKLGILKKEKLSQEEDLGRLFRFEQTSLKSVIERLTNSYGTSIILINKDLEQCQLTARYNKLPLEDVLDLIADSFSISVKKVGESYELDGEGCSEPLNETLTPEKKSTLLKLGCIPGSMMLPLSK